MSTTTAHNQPGLSSDQRSTIRNSILSTRHALEDELRRQLEKYGIYEDRRLPLEDLSHLSAEERHIRRTLDAAIERELESTEGDLERSITNYVREATKAYLNRLVALKTLEVRDLVEETITERPEYGNRSYMHHTVAEIAGELTNAPDDGFDATLDLAYQEIGAEIRIIFEESEHTAIDLDAQAREGVLDDLDAIDHETWESDEALGWVYQYFGEEEREDIDDRVDAENYKVSGTDIATKTQLFTPRYIVEWMVDNSLGRLWLEMQGNRTSIDNKNNCFYLAPLDESLIDREKKPVEEIRMLDPACGSGHILFYAFDVLYQMYLEESEVPKKYIPRQILQNNLYGIDIDTGATQIAALSLYLKAKEKSPEVTIPQLNIVSADAVLTDSHQKEEIIGKAQSDIEKEILEEIWRGFDHIRECGSLVQIEDQIDELLEDYRETFESGGQTQFTDDGDLTDQSTFISGEEEETWKEIKDRLMQNIREFAESDLIENNPVEEMFAGEIEKTVQLLDLFIQDYDIVISNPPYLSSGKMGENLKSYLKEYQGSRDLYSAFIERNLGFVSKSGYICMVTMETFMYLSSFEDLRQALLSQADFVDAIHLENRDKGYMNISFLMRKSGNKSNSPSRFNRILDMNEKIQGVNQITKANRSNIDHDSVYVVDQRSFSEIDGYPFVYWFGQSTLNLFDIFPLLGDIADIGGGVKTGDNSHHLRKFWEIPNDWIGDQYELFISHGDDREYYDRVDTTIRWENDGENIIEYSDKYGKHYQGLSDTSNYFKDGIIFRKFGNEFISKYIPGDCIYSFSAYFIDGKKEFEDNYLLAYLNSSLYRFMMDGINPGVHFNPSDAGAAPIKQDLSNEAELNDLVDYAINKRRMQFELDELSIDFNPAKFIGKSDDLQFLLDFIQSDLITLHKIIDSRIFDEFSIDKKSRERILEHTSGRSAHYPHIENAGSINTTEDPFREELPTERWNKEEYKTLIDKISDISSDGVSEISESLNVSPYTVSLIRRKHDLYSQEETEDMAARQLSYYLGCILGRWNLERLDPVDDGILTFNGEVMTYIQECMKYRCDESMEAKKQDIELMLGRKVRNWLRNRFFRYHHCKEYRRRGQRIPIYWQLESGNGAFSCFLYYHAIDQNTLPKLRGQYLDPRIDELGNELETLNAQTNDDDPDKELLERKKEVQNNIDDLNEFRNTIDEMIDDGVNVDVEKGIWENIKEWDQYEVLETGLPKLKSSYSR